MANSTMTRKFFSSLKKNLIGQLFFTFAPGEKMIFI